MPVPVTELSNHGFAVANVLMRYLRVQNTGVFCSPNCSAAGVCLIPFIPLYSVPRSCMVRHDPVISGGRLSGVSTRMVRSLILCSERSVLSGRNAGAQYGAMVGDGRGGRQGTLTAVIRRILAAVSRARDNHGALHGEVTTIGSSQTNLERGHV